MADESIQTFHGRVARIGDDVTVMVGGTLYGGDITNIDDVLDLPYCRFDSYEQNGGPYAYYDGEDKNLAPNDTFMWPYRPE
jgi:hypothetical protein